MRRIDLARIDGGSDSDYRGKSGQVVPDLGIKDKTPKERRDHQARSYLAQRFDVPPGQKVPRRVRLWRGNSESAH